MSVSAAVRLSDEVPVDWGKLLETQLERWRGGRSHGRAGDRVRVSGKHFAHNGEVHIYLISDKEHESRVDRCLLADIDASAKGTFSIVVTIPKGDCLEDNSHIVAVDVKTGDRAVVPFIGYDNDEEHED